MKKMTGKIVTDGDWEARGGDSNRELATYTYVYKYFVRCYEYVHTTLSELPMKLKVLKFSTEGFSMCS